MELCKLSVILGVVLMLASVKAQTPTPSPDFVCPGREDSIHPDPRDCTKYFVCTNGLAWHEQCPADLYFDPRTLQCDYPHLVQCFVTGPTTPTTPAPPPTTTQQPGSPTTPPTGTTSDPGLSTTEGPPPPTTTQAPPPTTTQAPPPTTTPPTGEFRCPTPDGYFPHPTKCESYYVCEMNVPSERDCPPGLHFDPDLLVCNWPEDAGCTAVKMFSKRHSKFNKRQ